MKCSCYRKDGRCLGTKEIEECLCGGDRFKCDFYDMIPTSEEAYLSMPKVKKVKEYHQKLYEEELIKIARTIKYAAENDESSIDLQFNDSDHLTYWEIELKGLGYKVNKIPCKNPLTGLLNYGILEVSWDNT